MSFTCVACYEHTSLTALIAYQSTACNTSTYVRLALHAPLQRLVALCALEPHKIVGDALIDGLTHRLGYLYHIFMVLKHRGSKTVAVFLSPIRAITWTKAINIMVEPWKTVATGMKQFVRSFSFVRLDSSVNKGEFTQLFC